MKREIILLAVLILLTGSAEATKRFVSKNGTSTPPYTNWESAADSMMKAMSISIPGDTIIIGEGVFTEIVRFNLGVTMIGSGWENTIIKLPFGVSHTAAVHLNDQTEISNLKIEGLGPENYNRGISCFRSDPLNLSFTIKNLKITKFFGGMSLGGSHSPIEDTLYVHDIVIDSCMQGISVMVNNIVIYNNCITASESSLYMNIGSASIVYDNIFVSEKFPNSMYYMNNFKTIYRAFNSPSTIFNNTVKSIYSEVDINCLGIEVGPDSIKNNLFTGNFGIAVRTDGNSTYRDIFNNHISGGVNYGFYGHSPLRFNNFWDNGRNYRTDDGSIIDSISNISKFPMFIDGNSDYHLQAFSPLIDKGDTIVKDKDSSRSDIGLYGGPFGKNYQYLDLPPLEPRGISASISGDSIFVSWVRNYESDFHKYCIYGDSIQNFTGDSSHLIGSTTDSSFTIVKPGIINSYFISLRSVDNQGNISETSEEIEITPVGINHEEYQVRMDYKLFQNYPNPFNPETVIGFRLKEEGRVILTVYTLTGERVIVLTDEILSAGYYESSFTGEALSSGIYLYKIDVRTPDGIPVFSEVKKMILMK
jgi:hypothetical protein